MNSRMIHADLHVHSLHSKHPGEWILQRLGASESYTTVETVYRLAKEQGNTYVTLTDHNTIDGALELCRLHPEDCFISTEATAYFPEDGCKVHVLCYGITPEQFSVIQQARENIYNLRDYLRQSHIACSVAHATYSVNNRLTLDHIEKLLVLFNVFEGINGTRGHEGNSLLQKVLQHLTDNDILRMSAKHHIDPWSSTRWEKGQTGGSDDHAGLFVGHTWTWAMASSKEEFIDAIRTGQTTPGGRYGDYKGLAYAIYKIAHEYIKQKRVQSSGLSGLLSSILFDAEGPSFRERLFLRKLGFHQSTRDQITYRFLDGLRTITQAAPHHDANWQINQAYGALGVLIDELTATIAKNLEDGIHGRSSQGILQYLSSAIPAIVFAAPFVSTLHVLNKSRELHDELSETFRLHPHDRAKRTLWFTDTFSDLNGVSVTLQEIDETAQRNNSPVRLVGCPIRKEMDHPSARQMLKLPCVYEFTPDFYKAHTVRLPSILKSLDLIAQTHPEKIVISTPGPVGLVGLIAARLLNIPCTGIFHTDFAKQAEKVIEDSQVVDAVGHYINWFYSQMDEVLVPSQAYLTQLSDQGLDRSRMKRFHRGLDTRFQHRDSATMETVRKRYFSGGRATLFYAGRLEKEKNLDQLANLFAKLQEEAIPVQLILAGEGSERQTLENRLSPYSKNVVFLGRVEREDLKAFYHLADLLIFPSTTDTFGMTVLEAQTLGLPALVSREGGPQEIIINGKTGYALESDKPKDWLDTCRSLLEMRRKNPDAYQAWRDEIKAIFATRSSWESLIDDITEKRKRVADPQKGFRTPEPTQSGESTRESPFTMKVQNVERAHHSLCESKLS